MTSIEEADSWIGRTAIDDSGEQIGMISQIWVDDASGRPEWASIMGPAIGAREALVPLAGAVAVGSGRQFAFTKAEIVDAPAVAADGRLELEEKEQLCSYYGPAADGASSVRDASWAGRMEDVVGSAPASGPSSPTSPSASEVPGGPPGRHRFSRRPARSEQKPGRRFGRSRAASAPPLEAMEPDEVPIGG
jgi:hypothetical protein